MSTQASEPESKPESENARLAPRRSRKGVLLGAGTLSIVAAAGALSLVAVPRDHADAHVEPHAPILLNVSPPEGFQVNLSGAGGRHYLAMNVNAEVEDLVENHASERAADPLYAAMLNDAVLKVASRKTKADLDDAVGREIFREELRVALDQVLFPVRVATDSGARHPTCGLRAGESIDRATMRGSYHEHRLLLDAPRKTIQLDGGAPVRFRGDETDLQVHDARGDSIYVDVSGLDPDFHGELPVGVLGAVRRVYFTAFLIQ